MKLKTLKIFIKVIDTGSYSKAAEKMGVTQPAISMQIKTLEEKLETQLVLKKGGKLKLTPAGKAVYKNAKQVILDWEKLRYEVEEKKEKSYKSIVIGSSTIPSEYILPNLLAKLSKDDPEIKSYIEVGDSTEMIEMLEEGDVDLILVGFKPIDKKYETIEIAEDKLKLITPNNHKLSQKQEIYINDLRNENLLIREVGSGTRKAMLDSFREAGLKFNDLNIKSRLGSTEAIIAAVQSGLGISFVSKFASSKAKKYGRVEELEVKDVDFKRKFYLAYNRNKEESELIEKVIKLLND